MKNTLMKQEDLETLPLNDNSLTQIFANLGYSVENLHKDRDSSRILIDIGCNFVDEIIDYCKMMGIKQLKSTHIGKAVKMKFGHSQQMKDNRNNDAIFYKNRMQELQKIDSINKTLGK